MKTVPVWDLATRVFHWTLAVLVIFQYSIGDIDGFLFAVHIYVGYTILTLVAYRIVWGLVGSPRSRFTDFVYPPSKAFAHARALLAGRPPHHVGHNPLGGYMVVALLTTILLTTLAGLVAHDDDMGGPLAVSLIGPGESVFRYVHAVLANVVIALVVIHVARVVADSVLAPKGRIIRAMITGRKPVTEAEAAAEPPLASGRRAALLALPFAVALIAAWASTDINALVFDEESGEGG